MKLLALIPAKGSSVRLKRKNLCHVGKNTLLSLAILSAIDSNIFDMIAVSTEDSEIAEISRKHMVDDVIDRPEALSRDPYGIVDVSLHALDDLEKKGKKFDFLAILAPTCPFRTGDDIRNAYQFFLDNECKTLMSVYKSDKNIFNAMSINDAGLLTPIFPDLVGKKPGTFDKTYFANGAIHFLTVDNLKKSKSYYAEPLVPFLMSRLSSIDIDDELDLRFANFVMQDLGLMGNKKI